MKKLLLISLILIIQPLQSFSSDNWTRYGRNINGNTFYYKNVKFFKGHVYVERMTDYLKPTKTGMMCMWDYREINCSDYSWRYLNFQSYGRPLCIGKGKFDQKTITKAIKKLDINFNNPGEIDYNISKKLCSDYR
tara:strand:+ start:128 stop:532 length:405 start_codon:yes stop_codon:yes gene_type:complete